MRRKSETDKRLAGTTRPDRAPGAAFTEGVGRVPNGLGQFKQAASLWRLLASELGEELRPADAPALQLLCLHYQFAMDAATELQEQGPVVEDAAHGGVKRNPAGMVMLQHASAAVALLKELGATPKSRPANAGPAEETLSDMLSLMTAGRHVD
jgi:P27 family predicted phage terminase small subunit